MGTTQTHIRLLAGLALGLLVSTQAPAFAHAGHDDEAPAAVAPAGAAPRAEAASAEFELVAVAKGQALVITLDHFATNEVTGAKPRARSCSRTKVRVGR